MTRDEIKAKILEFDWSRGETGRDAALGKITREEADQRYDEDLNTLLNAINLYVVTERIEARNVERQRFLEVVRNMHLSVSREALLDGRFDVMPHVAARIEAVMRNGNKPEAQ
ncbi:hypothetical protein [Mycolicibacterium neoaurum]|uniref:hypothetical protein n=1 Tax=Mycolicibacterium neoaurum TaxID=1795 RepID=UPI001F4C718F|nr:hypothetical protein [Mycolicibacterium neoaurum]